MQFYVADLCSFVAGADIAREAMSTVAAHLARISHDMMLNTPQTIRLVDCNR